MRRLFATTLAIIIFIAATPALAAEFWVSQNPKTKNCTIVETMPDGKRRVVIGATSYPTKDAAKAARKIAYKTGECIKKKKAE